MTGKIASRVSYVGRFLEVTLDRVRLPGGKETELEVLRHPGASAVVPLDENDNVLLIRQYRYAADGWLLEVPAGKLDPGESPEDCARREVEEEIGQRSGDLRPLGSILTSPGFTDERIWLFLATALEPGQQDLDEDEVLEVVSMPLGEAVEKALAGEIEDAKSVIALIRAWAELESRR